jgi:hypothetical protein
VIGRAVMHYLFAHEHLFTKPLSNADAILQYYGTSCISRPGQSGMFLLHILILLLIFRSSAAHAVKSLELKDGQVPTPNIFDLNLGDDVLRERQHAFSVTPSDENLIVLRDLKKEFPPQDGNPKKTAVENISLCITRGECFGCAPPSTNLLHSS